MTMVKDEDYEGSFYQNPALQRVLENSLELISSINMKACGKCAPCRIGHIRMEEILKRMTSSQGKQNDLETIYSLAKTLNETSFCPLGRKAPNQLLNSIDHITMIE